MSRSTTNSVAVEGRKLIALLSRWAHILALAVALLPSLVYLERIVEHDGQEFKRALDRRVREIAAMAYVDSRLWHFELHRIKDILDSSRGEPWRTSFVVEVPENGTWTAIVDFGERPSGPTITMIAPILDGDRTIGRVVGTRDVSHILIDVAVVVFASLVLGAAVLLLIRLKAIPFVAMTMDRLAENEDLISGHRDSLEIEVASRTEALAAANAKLQQSMVELERREQEHRELAAIVRSVDSAIVILRPDASIQWANAAFTQLSGYTPEEMIGRKPGQLLNGPATDRATVDGLNEAMRRGEPHEVELLQYTKSGEARWIETHATMLKDAEGRVQRCILIGHDVTERKAQQQRLDEALAREREINHQQRRFVSVVSHEFRTPLTIIDGAAQRLVRYADRFDPADTRERVDKIRRAVARMSELIETTLSAARVDSDAIELRSVPVDLAQIATGVVERIRGISPEFEIAIDSPASPLLVKGDGRLLDQVLTNLVTNAVKYSGASRRIDLSLGVRGDRAALSVRDHGVGIPADELPKLFTRFYRASTAKGLPGTGIGLNLARDLVAMHDGEITVDSEVGRGSTFTILLPLAAADDRGSSRAA
ncbi:MAG: PAS domain-containing sensor histidine kinase [Alphaproteobacteria bacterium]|nr:PAS domain-containing sensor histidine kinase [Alphaproteobacteria bacterium]